MQVGHSGKPTPPVQPQPQRAALRKAQGKHIDEAQLPVRHQASRGHSKAARQAGRVADVKSHGSQSQNPNARGGGHLSQTHIAHQAGQPQKGPQRVQASAAEAGPSAPRTADPQLVTTPSPPSSKPAASKPAEAQPLLLRQPASAPASPARPKPAKYPFPPSNSTKPSGTASPAAGPSTRSVPSLSHLKLMSASRCTTRAQPHQPPRL